MNEMEILVDNFLVKSIGLSNFNMHQIQHLLIAARVIPTCNQVECHPYFTQKDLTDFCNQKRILITGMNIFGPKDLLEDKLIQEMAKKYKRTPEQILLRYQIEKGHVTVPEVHNKSDLTDNLNVFKFEMNKSDVSAMDKLNRNKQYI